MMLFTARERFDSSYGDRWNKYLDFLGRNDLTRVVTLDTILCPSVIELSEPADWASLDPESTHFEFFTDLDFVQRKAAAAPVQTNILAVIPEPGSRDCEINSESGFRFAGFDLVDRNDEISALLNCGGFPESFAVQELSLDTGLLKSLDRALAVRDDLHRNHPEEHHADCVVWAIWEVTSR